MEIRKMIINDYEDIYNLWISCKGMGLNNLDDSKDGIEKFLKRNPETCLVAIEDDKAVGVIIIGNDGRRGYIYHTAVSPNHRKRGIGEKLVKKGLEALKNEGINKAALVVFEKNEGGNRFWGKMGFTERKDLVYRNREIVELERIDT